MNVARKLLPAAILCASVLLGGPAAAQPRPSSRVEVATRDLRQGPTTDLSEHDASDQASRLEEALERYRDIERRGGWDKVPTDIVMGPPYSYDCSRIAALERRLIVEGYLDHGSTPPPPPPPAPAPDGDKPPRPQPEPPRGAAPIPQVERCEYGPALTAAIRAFQTDRKVLGVGQLAKQTMAELNRPVQEIVDILEHDVERWRRVSLDPSGTYLLVNIPFFELSLYERGREILRMPVVVGQPSWPTPLLRDEVGSVIVNPDWGIPESIAKKEIWPTAHRDPGYFHREGIVASAEGLRQKPGPLNPLGRIKFVMTNQYNVYLHDTPGKRAFAASVRALSHGCIRLGQPIDLAHYLLREDPQWSPRRLQTEIASGRTTHIPLRSHMAVHIIYSTSWVNDAGHVDLRPDVYGENKRQVREDERFPRSGDGGVSSRQAQASEQATVW